MLVIIVMLMLMLFFYDLCARNNIYNILENSCPGPIDN